jgi:manganese oxidase
MRGMAATERGFYRLVGTVVALSALTGVAHLFVSSQYLSQWWGYGYFFIWAGLSQLGFAFLVIVQPIFFGTSEISDLRRGSLRRRLFLIGALGNAAMITLYVITRTIGVPFLGPAVNAVMPVEPLGVAVTLAELAVVVILLILARQRLPQRSDGPERATA